jgi:hypothetical protein
MVDAWAIRHCIFLLHPILVTYINKKFVMRYFVLGKEIEIASMGKPPGGYGSIFEFNGDAEGLQEIGLKGKFYYCAAGIGRFTNELTIHTDTIDLWEPKNHVLSIFLKKCIFNRRLTNQFEAPYI